MLLEFTLGNFLSFKEKKTISLEPASIKDFEKDNVFTNGRYQVLKGAVVYGANASGKSNLTTAFQTMIKLVLNSSKRSSTDKLDVTPFLLSTVTENEPSFFEVVFLFGDIRYRYGFEADKEAIRSEWLFEAKTKTEKPLFIREGDGIQVYPAFKEGKDLEERTRDNALFLSVVDQFNGSLSGKIIVWFAGCKVISALSHENFKYQTIDLLSNAKTISKDLNELYKTLDLGFEQIEIIEQPLEMPESAATLFSANTFLKYKEVFSMMQDEPVAYTKHIKYDAEGKIVSHVNFDMAWQESAGTNKIFNISGQILQALQLGGILIFDELDASLHPLITLAITRLFNSAEHNPRNAQLIFVTHDTNLLNYGRYRRDQIYFVEKDKYGASDLYSLVEYKLTEDKKVRNDASFEKDYIQGRYGAIPYIGDIQAVTDSILQDDTLKQVLNGKED